MTGKALLCRLFASVLLLSFAVCTSETGKDTANPASEQTKESPQKQPPGVHEGMLQVTAGPFIYGATEEHFRAYFGRSTMNFPGMEEALRRQFIIPPQSEDLPRFFIEEFEVTNREYKDFLDSSSYRPSDDTSYLKHWKRGTYPGWAADFPVVWVSQEDARQYCQWRGGFLPSEEQWEKASRGAGGRVFPWGNVFPSPETANFGRDQAEPVGNRAGDVSPYQVYDLAGNVSEWTSSRATIKGEEFLVARGGSFAEPARDTMSSRRRFQRSALASERRMQDIGFRCAAK